MHCSCIRQTELPHTSRLMADVLYHPDRTASFYHHPFRDLASFQDAAAEIQLPAGRRAALIEALRVQNAPCDSLERLAQPGTVAVMTGQQVGLFSGPSYTIYKALHAVRLAEWLTATGVSAVPVFWLATEDHDFAEVNHAWVFDSAHRPIKLTLERSTSARPVGDVELAGVPISQLREILRDMPYGDDVAALMEETYQAGQTMGTAFRTLLGKLLGRFGILYVDPMLPEFRQLAAPILSAAVKASPELTALILARNRELIAAGYHTQVHMEEQTSLFFLLENGKRLTLRRQGNDFHINGRRFTAEDLAGRASELSPNALLRPVVQDYMLPSVAYIGGQAEVAYLAQSEPIYRTILGRMPLALLRAGFTILDERSAKRMERYGLSLPDFSHGEETLRERLARKLTPPSLSGAMREAAGTIDSAIARMRSELEHFDPTLVKALGNSERKIRHQITRIESKTGREVMRRDERATRDAASLYGLLYPERHLQERIYSILPFLAKHGFELIEHLYGTIELECSDHRVMVA